MTAAAEQHQQRQKQVPCKPSLGNTTLWSNHNDISSLGQTYSLQMKKWTVLLNLKPQNEHEIVFSPANDMIEIFFLFCWPVQFTLPSVIWGQTLLAVLTQSLVPIPSTVSSSTQTLTGFGLFVFQYWSSNPRLYTCLTSTYQLSYVPGRFFFFFFYSFFWNRF